MSDEIIIHDMDEEDEAGPREKPSEVFKRYFGPEHGVALPPRNRYGYRPLDLSDGGGAMSSSRIFPDSPGRHARQSRTTQRREP